MLCLSIVFTCKVHVDAALKGASEPPCPFRTLVVMICGSLSSCTSLSCIVPIHPCYVPIAIGFRCGLQREVFVQLYGFSSAKKMASVLVDRGDGTLRLYNKGASEWVLNASVAVYEPDGSIAPLTEAKKSQLLQVVTEMASRGLRTLVCFSIFL
jgi:hypothetical protein